MTWLDPKEHAREELETAREWLHSHAALAKAFTSKVSQPHPFVWFGEVMELVATSINEGDPQAIKLGCYYLIDDPKCPFGRIFKRRVANALRRHHDEIPTEFRQPLINAPHKFDSHPFTPHEYKDLLRLSKALSQSA
ncbi:hypothetical protein [Geothrix alkalitolerans]|uniref:hypothetical protein n=1 Tax=Geothrix alkalitolerans TaxID=2922724 RepID=UPI001FAFAEFC|nr:hypothetical protein [Geothrix alkalitolerans]